MMCTSRRVYSTILGILGLILVVQSDDTCSIKGDDCGGADNKVNGVKFIDLLAKKSIHL